MRAHFYFFYTNTESFKQIWVNILISDFFFFLSAFLSISDGVFVPFLGRSIRAFGAGEPGWLFWSPLSVLRSRHAHALRCWKGVFLKRFGEASPHSCAIYKGVRTSFYCSRQGDGNMRYYEISSEKPYVHFLTEYRSHLPQKGMGEKLTHTHAQTQSPLCGMVITLVQLQTKRLCKYGARDLHRQTS